MAAAHTRQPLPSEARLRTRRRHRQSEAQNSDSSRAGRAQELPPPPLGIGGLSSVYSWDPAAAYQSPISVCLGRIARFLEPRRSWSSALKECLVTMIAVASACVPQDRPAAGAHSAALAARAVLSALERGDTFAIDTLSAGRAGDRLRKSMLNIDAQTIAPFTSPDSTTFVVALKRDSAVAVVRSKSAPSTALRIQLIREGNRWRASRVDLQH